MNIGLDIGYSAVKAITGNRRATFPSLVGTPDQARFSLTESESIILNHPTRVQVGAGAARQSRHIKRREDRAWIESSEWYALFLAAISELTPASGVSITLVTGLPVSFYGDKEKLQGILTGEHTFERQGGNRQTVNITECRVVPQPFGALLAECLSKSGAIVREPGNVGVIDAGGKTTNLLSVHGFEEIARETASVSAGAWDVARAVGGYLADNCPNLGLRDVDLMNAVKERRTSYYGELVDLSAIIDEQLDAMAEQVIAEASQLWNGGAGLDYILVTGGGALLLGDRLKAHFRTGHARVVVDPVWANAEGFYRLAQYLERA